MKIVIDTNVFVSFLFGGLPRQVVQLWAEGAVTLCLSEPIVDEYRRALLQFEEGYQEDVYGLLEAMASGYSSIYRAHPMEVNVVEEDPDDDKFLACALELQAEYIVTGDSHLDLESYMGITIVSPREFLKQFGNTPNSESD